MLTGSAWDAGDFACMDIHTSSLSGTSPSKIRVGFERNLYKPVILLGETFQLAFQVNTVPRLAFLNSLFLASSILSLWLFKVVRAKNAE